MTKTDQLQALWDALGEEFGASVIFRPFQGWFAVGEPRWVGDDGDYLGSNYAEATQAIRWLGKEAIPQADQLPLF